LERALTALLADLDRKKLAATNRPRPTRETRPSSRHISAAVTREVWRRDESRCAYVGPNGHRCVERAFLELHHKKPYAVGGEPTVENLELRCRRHNGYEARVYSGRFANTWRRAPARVQSN
jgi:5-methylcytosine-specific restriction endonuclease McrA